MYVIIEETQFITIAIKISTNGKNGPFLSQTKGRFHQFLHQTQENELFRVL